MKEDPATDSQPASQSVRQTDRQTEYSQAPTTRPRK